MKAAGTTTDGGITLNPLRPSRAERDAPTPTAWEGEVGHSASALESPPRPALSAPGGGEGNEAEGERDAGGLHHHRRRFGRLRPGQPADRGPRHPGVADRGGRARLEPADPHPGRVLR